MGKYAVKQPNGLYCYYGDSSHEIWAYNMTFEQLVQYNAETWGKTEEQAKQDMLWDIENPIYNWDELLEDWMYHENDIEDLMNADPATVGPCYDAQ